MRYITNSKPITGILASIALLLAAYTGKAQNSLMVNMAFLDGIGITPDNLLNYQVQSNMAKTSHALITGTIRYRNAPMRISYRFEYNLQPGINNIATAGVRPVLTYSEPALRELFEQYKLLPQGIYEYCVSVQPNYSSGEATQESYDECVYHKSEDIFLINLIDPENDAKLYEHNPMLSWTVNYPFASELKYRLRVAEIKQGQNNTIAINRNNPVYDERNLMQLSQVYPVYAKPLVINQPYAWTVDAYYKGILLGGAEAWKFTIIEDELLKAVSADQSYYDFAEHHGETFIYAIDTVKLKYRSFQSSDTFSISIADAKGDPVKFKTGKYPIHSGINLIDLNIPGNAWLKHSGRYMLTIRLNGGDSYTVPFIYVNPLYLKK